MHKALVLFVAAAVLYAAGFVMQAASADVSHLGPNLRLIVSTACLTGGMLLDTCGKYLMAEKIVHILETKTETADGED